MTKKDDPRAQRLAAALRENLRRRKAQSRASADEPGRQPGLENLPVDSSES